jgi:hypothetical protein
MHRRSASCILCVFVNCVFNVSWAIFAAQAQYLVHAGRPMIIHPQRRPIWPLKVASALQGRSKWLLAGASQQPERSKLQCEHFWEPQGLSKWLLPLAS